MKNILQVNFYIFIYFSKDYGETYYALKNFGLET